MSLRTKTIAFTLLGWLGSILAHAETTAVYQINDNAGAFLQTVLTHDIYRYATQPDLNDVVVIDKHGNKLPFRIAAPDVQTTESSTPVALRFFPVAVGAPPETLLALSSASIRLDANEISVSVEKKGNDELLDKSAPIDFYVVDVSDLKLPVDALLIDWQATDKSQYLEVQVSGTNDLQNWTTLSQNTLVQLKKDGQTLTRNKIDLQLADKEYAYLRLKFLRGGEALQLTQIRVEHKATPNAHLSTDSWQIPGELADEQESVLPETKGSTMPVAAWEFARDDIAPVTKIALELGSTAYGDRLKIFARTTPKQAWQMVYQGIWFNAQVGQAWQHSDAITIANNHQRYWRVELNAAVQTALEPQLIFSQEPKMLQFVANNAAPYSIAIDSAAAANNQATNAQIFRQLIGDNKQDWLSVNITPLNPDINSFANNISRFHWQALLFWSVLIIAVGVLAAFAFRLYQQMNLASNNKAGSDDIKSNP